MAKQAIQSVDLLNGMRLSWRQPPTPEVKVKLRKFGYKA